MKPFPWGRLLWGPERPECARDGRGLSLVEVMLVVLVLGIVAVAGVPVLTNSLDGMRLDAAAEEVVTVIRYARHRAMQDTGAGFGVSFDPDANAFRCYEISTGKTVLHPLDKKDYVIDFDGIRHLKGVVLDDADFHGDPFVEFDAMGDSTFRIDKIGVVSLRYAGQTKTIVVSPPAGKVSVQ